MVWDNQQATNWFVGILEGEGSFYRRSLTNKRVIISNNDLDVINFCEKFLSHNNILFNTYKVKAGTKIGYKVTVTNVDCRNLYNIILPSLQCRLNEYQLILGASETVCDLSVNLYWLIGIFEAEGSFCISENHRGHLTPKIELDNTNSRIIDKIVKTLYANNLSWYIKNYLPEKRKAYTKITIQGVKRCIRFLILTENLWQTKKNLLRSKLMLDYCRNRLQKSINAPYDLSDYVFKNQMIQINR